MPRLTRRLTVPVLLAVCPLPAIGQSVTVLRAGRLIDVERAEVRRDQVVVIA